MLRALTAVMLFLSLGCSKSPVPSGVFLSLSVSTGDIAVETAINGKANAYLSGASGAMVASGPINANVAEGANEITFSVSRAAETGETFEPWLVAALEIGVKGEMIDTSAPGKRLIFQRELTEDDIVRLIAGEAIVLTETFEISPKELKDIKRSAEMAPKATSEPATGH